MEIVKQKVNFITRQKLLIKVNNFWKDIEGESIDEKMMKMLSTIDVLEKFHSLSVELVSAVATGVNIDGALKKPVDALESFDNHEDYFQLFNICFAEIKPREEKN